MTPYLLAGALHRFGRDAAIYIAHMEPGREEETMREISRVSNSVKPIMLSRSDVLEF